MPMERRIDERTEQSAWVFYFNQATSDLTGIDDAYSPDSVTQVAANMADAAIKMLKKRCIRDDYWPTASR